VRRLQRHRLSRPFRHEIRELIISKAPIAALKKAAKAAGTMFLRESAVAKVLAGETTLKEINRVTFVE
jgi:type IV pilus assembly protein PilB